MENTGGDKDPFFSRELLGLFPVRCHPLPDIRVHASLPFLPPYSLIALFHVLSPCNPSDYPSVARPRANLLTGLETTS